MRLIESIKAKVGRGNEAFRFGQFGGAYGANDPWGGLWRMLSGSTFDYRREAGITWENSIVASGVSWVMRNFPRARLYVERPTGKVLENGESEYKEIPGHPLTMLFAKPNPYYSRSVLWKGIILSRMVDGNAYIYVNRNKFGMPCELYYVPHYTCSARWLGQEDSDTGFLYPGQSSNYLNYWEHRVDGRIDKWKPWDVFHWRDGIDPQNARRGLSPLVSVLREIAADNCASTMSASLLRNNNVPGLIVSAKETKDGTSSFESMTDVQTEKMREMAKQKWTGDRAGELAVFPVPVDLNRMSWSPKEMDLAPLRTINQELVLAQWGLTKAVIGLGKDPAAGGKANATLKSQIAQAYDSCLIPMQDDLAEELTFWGQREFGGIWQDGDRVAFDRSKISALQDDVNELHDRVRADWMADLILRSDARKILGMAVTPEDEAYYSQVAGQSASGDTIEPLPEKDPEDEVVQPDDEVDDAVKSVKKKSTKSEDDDEEDDDDDSKKKGVVFLLGLIAASHLEFAGELSQYGINVEGNLQAGPVSASSSFNPATFAKQMQERLLPIHTQAATLGRLRAMGVTATRKLLDNPTSADILAGQINTESQVKYLQKLGEQIEAGEVSEPQIAVRIKAFGQRAVGTANDAWKDSLPDDALLTWNDTGDEAECGDCSDLADGSPYTSESIPTMPGMGDTECSVNCRCFVTTEDGDSSFYHPDDEMP